MDDSCSEQSLQISWSVCCGNGKGELTIFGDCDDRIAIIQ